MSILPDDASLRVLIALAGGAIATAILHVVIVTLYLPENLTGALPLLFFGWATFAVAWYALGQLFSTPSALPRSRSTDVGLGLFVLSVLVGGGLDFLGMTPELAPLVHVPLAAGVYVGLALAGWGLGSRSKSINRRLRRE